MELINNLSERAIYDYKIVQKAVAGDEKAYAELFKRYKDSVLFMISYMVSNRNDAEDLMFAAFEKAFANLDQYDSNIAFSTWIYKIASNTTIDFIRKKKNLLNDFDANEALADEDRLSEELERQQRADFMRKKVSLLKARYRKLIELRYFDEYSYEEIAEELAISLNTVKKQLFRARQLLLNMLQNLDDELAQN